MPEVLEWETDKTAQSTLPIQKILKRTVESLQSTGASVNRIHVVKHGSAWQSETMNVRALLAHSLAQSRSLVGFGKEVKGFDTHGTGRAVER
jgi:hypothetical protein